MGVERILTLEMKDVAVLQIGLSITFALFPIGYYLIPNPIPSPVSRAIEGLIFLGIAMCTGYIALKGGYLILTNNRVT